MMYTSNLLKMEFEHARIKHLAFKSKLRSYLYGNSLETEALKDPSLCAVGKWINELGAKHLGDDDLLLEVTYIHEEIHDAARRIIVLYSAGKTQEAREKFTEVDEIGKRLLKAMDDLEISLNKMQ